MTEPLGSEYRKTSTIRAVQWFKLGDHPSVVMFKDLPFLMTPVGWKSPRSGEWIVPVGVGYHDVIAPDVFAATYEPVEGAEAQSSLVGQEDIRRLRLVQECGLIDPSTADRFIQASGYVGSDQPSAPERGDVGELAVRSSPPSEPALAEMRQPQAAGRDAIMEAFRKGAMFALGRRHWDDADDYFTLVGMAYASGEPLPSIPALAPSSTVPSPERLEQIARIIDPDPWEGTFAGLNITKDDRDVALAKAAQIAALLQEP